MKRGRVRKRIEAALVGMREAAMISVPLVVAAIAFMVSLVLFVVFDE